MSQTINPKDDLTEVLTALQQLLPVQCSLVSSALGQQPTWFRDMGDGTAITVLEDTHGVLVANSIRLFYQYPAYAVFLQVHSELNVFLDDWNVDGPPEPLWTHTTYPPWLAISSEPIAGDFLMVRLDSRTPEMSSRYMHTEEDACVFPESFDAWLLSGARDTLKSIESRKGCFACEEASGS